MGALLFRQNVNSDVYLPLPLLLFSSRFPVQNHPLLIPLLPFFPCLDNSTLPLSTDIHTPEKNLRNLRKNPQKPEKNLKKCVVLPEAIPSPKPRKTYCPKGNKRSFVLQSTSRDKTGNYKKVESSVPCCLCSLDALREF